MDGSAKAENLTALNSCVSVRVVLGKEANERAHVLRRRDYSVLSIVCDTCSVCGVSGVTKYWSDCKALRCAPGYLLIFFQCKGQTQKMITIPMSSFVSWTVEPMQFVQSRGTEPGFCTACNSYSLACVCSCTCRLQSPACQELLVRVQGFGVHTWLQSLRVQMHRSDSGSCVHTRSSAVLKQCFVM